jgi:regulator of sirC expression with transglutaminase-like and TPR domain
MEIPPDEDLEQTVIDASPSKIDALVRLLGDEDPEICTVAWRNLEKIGEPALATVERATHDEADVRVQVQCTRFLREWSRRDVLRRWVQFCRNGRVHLEEGVFLLAETEYPDADMAECRRQLDGFASVLRGRLETARSVEEAVKRISSFLFSELGFRGNGEDYYNPENSYLNRVLEHRRGIPISLCAIFLLVARRLSVPVHGVGLPQHFVLKYRGPAGDVFIDPYHGGKLLTARDCLAFLGEAHLPFVDEYLRAVTDAEILTRMLGNLLKIYLSVDDQRRYDRLSAMLKLLT